MLYNRSVPAGVMIPRLIYQDVDKAIAWLCGAFGFTERFRTPPEPDGTIHHAQLAFGSGGVILTGQPAMAPFAPPQPTGSTPYLPSLLVRVDDVDAHYEQARQYGARVLGPPVSHEYGERQYTAEDLGGYRWGFSQSVSDIDPASWGAKVAQLTHPIAQLPKPRLCYLEMPAADAHQSAAFYEQLFGWNIRHRDTPRPSFDDVSSVSGAWVTGRPPSREPGLLPYIWVDHLETTLARAVALGAEVVSPPHPDHPGSTSGIATFRDPAGNLIGLYQEDRS
jgi:predicted enzyme related to lactoylglutathione lyase